MTTAKRGPRLAIIPADAVIDPDVSAMSLRVLAAFGRHTDRAGFCFRSLRKLADELKLARSTVQRAIAQLIEAGWLVRFRGQRQDGGDCASGFRVLRRKRGNGSGEPDDGFAPPAKPVYGEPEEGAVALPGGPQAGGPQENGPIKTKEGDEAAMPEAGYVREVKARLQKIGWTVTPAWFRHGDAPIKAWFWAGCDIERDVMPAILAVLLNGRERPASLSYFTKAIFRARASRRDLESLTADHPAFAMPDRAAWRAERNAYHAAFDAIESEILAEEGQ